VEKCINYCQLRDKNWQRKWDLADHGRFAHSILPRVSILPWFEGQKEDRSFVTSVSRIMSGHSSVRSHLDIFGIVEDPMCVCLQEYETVDHLIWHCERFGSERHRLIDGTPVRDLCGLRKWSAIECCLDFLGNFKIRFWSDYFPLCRCGVSNLFQAVHLELETPFI
jgi:hypothetical protein